MYKKFVCVSETVYETFDDLASAKEFAKDASKKSCDMIIIYLQFGTMCGAVAQFFGGNEIQSEEVSKYETD